MADSKKAYKDAIKANDAVSEAEKALQLAISIRSDAVKAFVASKDGSQGPFRDAQGNTFTIRCRRTYAKTDEKKEHPLTETWFFVNPSEVDAEEI
jgi:hypothetical protein